MSIIVCKNCSRYVDTDFHPSYEGPEGGDLCESCDEERQETFHSLLYRHAEDGERIKMLAKLKTSQDLWPPREVRRLARQYREIAEALEKIAEREVNA